VQWPPPAVATQAQPERPIRRVAGAVVELAVSFMGLIR